MPKLNYRPELISLIDALIAAGFKLHHGNNGGNDFSAPLVQDPAGLAPFIDELMACDDSYLFVAYERARPYWIHLVFGNSPGELCSDYVVFDKLEEVISRESELWFGREQPVLPELSEYTIILRADGHENRLFRVFGLDKHKATNEAKRLLASDFEDEVEPPELYVLAVFAGRPEYLGGEL